MDSNFPDVVLRPGGGRRYRVLFSYSPQNVDELQLEVNDEIDFLAEVEDGWWRGRLGNKVGVFPSNFVCEVGPEESCPTEGDLSASLSSPDSVPALDDAPVLPPKPVKETCRVLYAYDAANDDELTLKKDDVITIITKEVEDKGWWKGELRGRVGLFPDNFVEVMSPPEDASLAKKPDRPSKAFDPKPDPKTQGLVKTLHDAAATPNDDPNKKIQHNSDKSKSDPKFGDRASFPGKTDSHRKLMEIKSMENLPPSIAAKKPVLPPPFSSKPKPGTGKSTQVKRLSEELNDLIETKSAATAAAAVVVAASKRMSADASDLVDGGIASKLGCYGFPPSGGGKEDFDLDIVERSDMLKHMTSSRPRPPGRRLPTKEAKDAEPHSPLTNGNVETNDKEKSQKEREWEKHKPPWVNELKLNLKSNKTSPSDSKTDRKSGQPKPAPQSPGEALGNEAGVNAKQFTCQATERTTVESGWKVSELSSKFSELSSKFSEFSSNLSGKPLSPPKPPESSWNSLGDQPADDVIHISKKEFVELKTKVEKLERMMLDLGAQLAEEVDKRKVIEKELNKLTDLVTQV